MAKEKSRKFESVSSLRGATFGNSNEKKVMTELKQIEILSNPNRKVDVK